MVAPLRLNRLYKESWIEDLAIILNFLVDNEEDIEGAVPLIPWAYPDLNKQEYAGHLLTKVKILFVGRITQLTENEKTIADWLFSVKDNTGPELGDRIVTLFKTAERIPNVKPS